MKFEDTSQNLRARLGILNVLVVLMLAGLGVRLYLLQIVRGKYYAEVAENQRIRRLPIPAQRGVIFDRNGKALVDSRPIYEVILSSEDVKGKNLAALAAPISAGLGVDVDILSERFDQVKSLPAFQIAVKPDATPGDIAWVESHKLEFPELRVEQQPQRRYPPNGKLAHVLGYVGEISPEQLKQNSYKDKGLKSGDVIGLSGLEQTYDDYLRGHDGYREVVVDSRGRIQDEIAIVPPQPGQDLITSIDPELQDAAEEQLRISSTKRGVIIVMDPNNGEILALASAPTFDPNLFQRITTKAGRAEYLALIEDPEKPLLNRAVQSRYMPGSTWKIPMAIAGLQQGAITIDHSNIMCGGGITIGNKFTRCMGNHGTPDLRYAITHSCDGYFYRLGLKMGIDGIGAMVDEFDLNKRTGIDLPNEVVSWTPSREFKARMQPKDPEWREIDTVYASFGQVYDVITPIALLRTVAGVSVGGSLYVPHLVRQIKPAGDEGKPGYRAGRLFQPFDASRPNPKMVPIPEEEHHLVVEGMWGVVNNGGTGSAIKMAGFDIAGKTGTAQVVGLGKDIGANKDHAWFVSYAPAYKPEISIIALIENSGFGGKNAAPAVRAVYDVYYRKTRHEEPPGAARVAQNKSSQPIAVSGQQAALR
jgi:penicillin-binding protein 2